MHSIIATLTGLGVPASDAVTLSALHAIHDQAYITSLGQAVLAPYNLPATRLVALAASVPNLAAADVVTLTALHAIYPNDADLIALGNAVVAGLAGGRTAADVVTLVQMVVGWGAPAPSGALVADLMRHLPAYSVNDLATLAYYMQGVTGAEIRTVMGWLAPLSLADIYGLLRALRTDGLTAVQIHQLMFLLHGLGLNHGNMILAWIEYLRGSLDHTGSGMLDAVTTAGGERILTAQQLLYQANRVGTAAYLAHYPVTGIDPTSRTENQLWDDCHPALRVGEATQDRDIRQRLALSQLMNLGAGILPQIVQRLFLTHAGQTPRPVLAPNDEDALGGGQTDDRHVLGTGGGMVDDLNDLALRACGHKPGAYSPRVGAFTNRLTAQVDMQIALNALIANPTTNWAWLRARIIRGRTTNRNIVVGVGVSGRVATVVGLTPIPLAALPPYNGGQGGCPMYPTEPFIANMTPYEHPVGSGNYFSQPTGGGVHIVLEPANPLTTLNPPPPLTRVHLRIIAADVVGGWFIHSAWPIP